MPAYHFNCDKCGRREVRLAPHDQVPRRVKCSKCGAYAHRVFGAQVAATLGRQMISMAAGVDPSQVDEARRQSVEMGVPTDFTPDGDAIFTSRSHRKRYCEKVGLHDRDGGYGDPSPQPRES
ncbi:MAG: hypothetical protein JXA57_15215 [Armatimonadetes bacterium]|nr:hypothetical protein [Armatimonadota bacterium]